MSFIVNPEEYDYGTAPNICPACFDINKSPDSVFLCVNGILPGDNFFGIDPGAPFGIFEIHTDAPCQWHEVVGAFDFFYGIIGINTVCSIGVVAGPNVFSDTILGHCKYAFTNVFNFPAGRTYYKGQVRVVVPLEGGVLSVQEIALLLANETNWAKWCNPIYKSDTETVYKFYKRTGKTNIKILVEDP